MIVLVRNVKHFVDNRVVTVQLARNFQSGCDCTIGKKLYNYRESLVNIEMKTVIASKKFSDLLKTNLLLVNFEH